MAFHNVPPNGFPDIPDIEDLEAVQGEVDQLKSGLTNVDIALNVPTNSGKNLVDDTSFDSYTSDKGITVTPDGTGGIAVSGTNSGTGATGVLLMKSGYDIQLKGGVTYRFSGNWNGVTPGSNTIRVDLRPYNTLDVLASETAEGVGTYTPTNDIRVRVFVRVAGSYAIPNDVKAYPVLTELQNTSYVPYVPSVESRIEAVESGLTNVDIISDTTGFRVLRSVNTVTVLIDTTVTNGGSSDAWVDVGTYSGNHAPRYNVYSQVFDNNNPGTVLSNRSIKIYNSSGTTKVQAFLAKGETILARGSVTYIVS